MREIKNFVLFNEIYERMQCDSFKSFIDTLIKIDQTGAHGITGFKTDQEILSFWNEHKKIIISLLTDQNVVLGYSNDNTLIDLIENYNGLVEGIITDKTIKDTLYSDDKNIYVMRAMVQEVIGQLASRLNYYY